MLVPKHGHPENPDVAFTVRALPEDPSDTEADATEFAPGDWTLPARSWGSVLMLSSLWVVNRLAPNYKLEIF